MHNGYGGKTTVRALNGEEFKLACEMPIVKPNTKEWKEAVDAIRNGKGKGVNIRVNNRDDALKLINEAKGNSFKQMDTYTDTPYKSGYELHPNEAHLESTPHQDLEHIKFKDWEKGKSNGNEGHIFF